eukprot:Rhum_TRINITY_DN12225_c0_g1::Rhum_TRINITY_DN12225_c0_g1_i1::g.50222::m.50222
MLAEERLRHHRAEQHRPPQRGKQNVMAASVHVHVSLRLHHQAVRVSLCAGREVPADVRQPQRRRLVRQHNAHVACAVKPTLPQPQQPLSRTHLHQAQPCQIPPEQPVAFSTRRCTRRQSFTKGQETEHDRHAVGCQRREENLWRRPPEEEVFAAQVSGCPREAEPSRGVGVVTLAQRGRMRLRRRAADARVPTVGPASPRNRGCDAGNDGKGRGARGADGSYGDKQDVRIGALLERVGEGGTRVRRRREEEGQLAGTSGAHTQPCGNLFTHGGEKHGDGRCRCCPRSTPLPPRTPAANPVARLPRRLDHDQRPAVQGVARRHKHLELRGSAVVVAASSFGYQQHRRITVADRMVAALFFPGLHARQQHHPRWRVTSCLTSSRRPSLHVQ